jgi:hypothetical protein
LLILLSSHHLDEISCDVSWVETGNGGAPTGTNTFSTIDEGERDDREVVVWLDALAFFFQIVQKGIIILMEEGSGHWVK